MQILFFNIFFSIQYLPHEIIKKVTWFIYHPRVIKFRLQVIHIFKKSFGMKEAVADDIIKEGGIRRFTIAANTMLDDVADDIIGRQVRYINTFTCFNQL
jgi:hypothetical protein